MFHFCISLTFSGDLLPKTHRKTWSLSEQWCPSRLWRGWNCLLICLESGWLKTLNCAVTELVSGASHQRHFKWSSKVFTAHFLAVFTLWFKLCKKTFQNSCLAFTVLKWCYLTSEEEYLWKSREHQSLTGGSCFERLLDLIQFFRFMFISSRALHLIFVGKWATSK